MASKAHVFNGRKRVRKVYGHITEVTDMPNLIEVQMSSYDAFLMVDEPEGGRGDEGLQDKHVGMQEERCKTLQQEQRD